MEEHSRICQRTEQIQIAINVTVHIYFNGLNIVHECSCIFIKQARFECTATPNVAEVRLFWHIVRLNNISNLSIGPTNAVFTDVFIFSQA